MLEMSGVFFKTNYHPDNRALKHLNKTSTVLELHPELQIVIPAPEPCMSKLTKDIVLTLGDMHRMFNLK